jgi:O-antigen/teichoic acid export membrane protein
MTGTSANSSWPDSQIEARQTSFLAKARTNGPWKRHREFITNVTALLSTTGISLLLGFGYWNIAARLFNQQQVGYGSAAIAAMTLVSAFGNFGLNTLLLGDLPKRSNRAGLIAAAMLASAAGALVLAVAFVLIVPHFTSHYNDVAGSVGAGAVFCLGVALTAASGVFDAATIGLLRGGLQLTRNIAFVVTKIVTLVCVALAFHYTLGIGIFASWVAAIPVSLIVVAVRLWLSGTFTLPRPDWQVLKSLGRVLAAHNWLNVSLQVPGLMIPVIAASILTPSTNAAYYVAVTITSGLFIVPAHISTVLFTLGSADPGALPRRLRFAIRVTLLVGIAGMAILALGAHFVLGIFGGGYAKVAALPMQIMALAFLPSVPNFFYISVARATNRLAQAAAVVTGFAALNVVAVTVGALQHGLIGMAVADVMVISLEALVTTPRVVRTAIGRGRHRRAALADALSPAPVVVGGHDQWIGRDGLWHGGTAREYQQLRGLALLMSMAQPTTATMLAATTDTAGLPAIRGDYVGSADGAPASSPATQPQRRARSRRDPPSRHVH